LKVALNIKNHKPQTFSFIYSKIATRLQMSGTPLLSCRREVHNLYIIIAAIVLTVSQKWRYLKKVIKYRQTLSLIKLDITEKK
jgi:hypothetical protein